MKPATFGVKVVDLHAPERRDDRGGMALFPLQYFKDGGKAVD